VHHFHRLAVAEVRQDTAEAIVVTLSVPESLHTKFEFIQGQHITLRAFIEGEEVRRVYSIASGKEDGKLQIAIKRVNGGVFSNWAHRHLRPGDGIDASPPIGSFFVALDHNAENHYAAFVAGSGITPLMSIIPTTLAVERKSQFTLVYVNRSQRTMMFREALAALKNRYLSRFNLISLFSGEQADCEILGGRLDASRSNALFESWLPVQTVDYAFLCGPSTMMDVVGHELRKRGMRRDRILREYFAPAGNEKRAQLTDTSAQPSLAGSDLDMLRLSVKMDGVVHSLVVPRRGHSVLDAALAAGIDIPYACRSGVCGTCRCTVTEGEVTTNGNYALSDPEIARGVVLGCRSIAVSSNLSLDFDQIDSGSALPGLVVAKARSVAVNGGGA
jgi:ring-1,2-phenylacetyl-CoA epoxidase subunit PaaE